MHARSRSGFVTCTLRESFVCSGACRRVMTYRGLAKPQEKLKPILRSTPHCSSIGRGRERWLPSAHGGAIRDLFPQGG